MLYTNCHKGNELLDRISELLLPEPEIDYV